MIRRHTAIVARLSRSSRTISSFEADAGNSRQAAAKSASRRD